MFSLNELGNGILQLLSFILWEQVSDFQVKICGKFWSGHVIVNNLIDLIAITNGSPTMSLTFVVYNVLITPSSYFFCHFYLQRWQKWRIKEIKKDFQYCHPRWPQESSFLQSEIEEIKDQAPAYFSDSW